MKATGKTVEALVTEVNQRLKAGRCGVTICLRPGRNKLYLRGIFPPKPGSTHITAHQQFFTLDLPASITGVKVAENQAKTLGAKLTEGKFHWEDYLVIKVEQKQKAVGTMLTSFETEHWSKTKQTDKSLTTWSTNYEAVYRQLDKATAITPEYLKQVILKTKPDTRQRLRYCLALSALARHAQLDTTFIKELKGKYGQDSTLPRDIPTDQQVIQVWESINPLWLKWCFGMLATYGLRPHELHRLDLSDLGNDKAPIRVSEDSKTGARLVFPLHQQWVETFGLREIHLPTRTSATANRDLGKKFCTAFKDYGIGFPPYHLRHAWAVRAIHVGLDSSVAARMMGHSLTVHNRSYQKWLSETDIERAYGRVIQQ